jgi:hypothetical protein
VSAKVINCLGAIARRDDLIGGVALIEFVEGRFGSLRTSSTNRMHFGLLVGFPFFPAGWLGHMI